MDFNYALAAVSPKVEAAFLARFALNIWLNSYLWVTTSLTNHGTSFGCGQVNWSRTGTVRSFLSNSICPHFNFLSFLSYASMSRGSSRYPIALLIGIIKAQPQSSSHMWLLRICLLMEQEEESGKNANIVIDVAYLPVSASSHLGWEFIARGLANEQTPPGEYDKLFETLERRPSHWRQQIRH